MCEKFAIHSRRMFSNQSQRLSALKSSLKNAQFQGFRVLLVLAGNAAEHVDDVCEAFKDSVSDQDQAVADPHSATRLSQHMMHVPDQHSNADITDQITKLLGGENSCLVFDANGGFDPRLLAASAGTVIAGGLFILITPPLHEWLNAESVSVGTHSLFLQRFAKMLIEHQAGIDIDSTANLNADPKCLPNDIALLIHSDVANNTLTSNQASAQPDLLAWKVEQDALVAMLLDRLNNPTSSPAIVVQGDRGRGKSALVGRALRQCTKETSNNDIEFTVCASTQNACKVLLKHAADSIAGNPIKVFSIEQALACEHNMLIVEEAGSIPIAILEKLMARSKLIVFITTVQGYEGAGRGFAIRFSKRLDLVSPGWLKLNPVQPVRWAPNDPVEKFINDAFLLDLEPKPLDPLTPIKPIDANVSLATKRELMNDEHLLRDVYGLLIQAHYQTTPADLRNILDSENVLVFVQHTNKRLTGAALVALEGNIPTALHDPIIKKQRRLSDQIIPQLLAQSCTDPSGLSLRYARIVRIAIVPSIQNRGFGKHLYAQLSHLLEEHVDCIGASFGADNASLSFWLALGLQPIHYGFKVNPRSGLRAACLASSQHPQLSVLVDNATSILNTNMKALVQHQIKSDSVAPLIVAASEKCEHKLQADLSLSNLIAFKNGHRSFIDTVGLLLAHEPARLDATFKAEIEQTIAQYAQLSPAQRRTKETHFRDTLSQYLD